MTFTLSVSKHIYSSYPKHIEMVVGYLYLPPNNMLNFKNVFIENFQNEKKNRIIKKKPVSYGGALNIFSKDLLLKILRFFSKDCGSNFFEYVTTENSEYGTWNWYQISLFPIWISKIFRLQCVPSSRSETLQ